MSELVPRKHFLAIITWTIGFCLRIVFPICCILSVQLERRTRVCLGVLAFQLTPPLAIFCSFL